MERSTSWIFLAKICAKNNYLKWETARWAAWCSDRMILITTTTTTTEVGDPVFRERTSINGKMRFTTDRDWGTTTKIWTLNRGEIAWRGTLLPRMFPTWSWAWEINIYRDSTSPMLNWNCTRELNLIREKRTRIGCLQHLKVSSFLLAFGGTCKTILDEV